MKRYLWLWMIFVAVIAQNGFSGTEGTVKAVQADRQLLTEREKKMLLQKMRSKLQTVKSLRTEFVQKRHLAIFLDTLTAKGVCYFKAPDKFRWELTEPYTSVLIHNHKRVEKFDVFEGEIRRLKLGVKDVVQKVLREIMAWMQGDFQKTKDVYDLKIFKGADYLMVLTPRSKEMLKMLNSIELSVAPDSFQITRVTLREPAGDRVEIIFAAGAVNVDLDEALFDMKKPARFPAASEVNG